MTESFENLMRNVRNDDDPDYDEDAAVCECTHTFRNHCGRAFNYQCALDDCECKTFRGRTPTTEPE